MVLADLHEELAHALPAVRAHTRTVDEKGCSSDAISNQHVVVAELPDV